MGDFFSPKEQDMESTATVGLPEFAMPYLQEGLSMASKMAGRERKYPANFYRPMTGIEERGIRGMGNLGGSGGAVVDSATSHLNDVLGGQYLDPEVLSRVTQGAVNRAMPDVNAPFFGQGGGGGMRGAAMTEALGNIMSDQYNLERDRMMTGLNLAPGIERLAYTPYDAMITSGNLLQEERQNQLDAKNYAKGLRVEEPRLRTGEYIQNIGGLLPFAGRTQTNNWTEYGPSPFQSALGVAGTVAGIGGPKGFGWWGPGTG